MLRTAMESPAQVSVVFLEPVLADGAEDVEVERVCERHGAVRHVRGNAQDLPFSDHDHAAADLELERAFENIGDLLALVVVFRHDRPLGEEDLRHHGLVARNDLARDGVAQDLFLHLVPSVEFHVRLSPCDPPCFPVNRGEPSPYKNTRNPRDAAAPARTLAPRIEAWRSWPFQERPSRLDGVRLRKPCLKPLSPAERPVFPASVPRCSGPAARRRRVSCTAMRSPEEISFRLRQELGNLAMFLFPPGGAGARHARSPMLPDAAAAAATLRETAYAAEVERIAGEILSHRFPILGLTVDTGPAIDWRRDYLHGVSTGTPYFRRSPYLDFSRAQAGEGLRESASAQFPRDHGGQRHQTSAGHRGQETDGEQGLAEDHRHCSRQHRDQRWELHIAPRQVTAAGQVI